MDDIQSVRLPDEYDGTQLDSILAGKYETVVEAPVSERWTFFDTFDWRLFNRSYSLRYAGDEFTLSSLSDGLNRHNKSSLSSPLYAWNIADGPVKKRLQPIVKARALMALAEISVRTNTYRILNRDEKTVARVVYIEAHTTDDDTSPLLGAYLSLRPVRGYPKHARRLEQLLAKHVDLSDPIDSVEADIFAGALEAAGKEPSSYSGKVILQLEPDCRSDEATKLILRRLLEIMRANETGIKADVDIEFLHDFRIAIRRTRSALSQIKSIFPPEATRRFKEDFAYLGKLSNDLRDLDVYLLSESSYQARLPATMRDDLVPLFNYLRIQRGQALERVITGLNSEEYKRILSDWEQFLDEPLEDEAEAPNAAMPVIDLARQRIYKRYRRVVKDGHYILTHTEDELLHALRIDVKKLRYLMEFFVSLFLRKQVNKLIKHVKILQDNLGDFNDFSVQRAYLLHVAELLPLDDPGTRKALLATGYLVETLEREQQAVKDNFAETFTEFASPGNRKLFRRLYATKGKKGAGLNRGSS